MKLFVLLLLLIAFGAACSETSSPASLATKSTPISMKLHNLSDIRKLPVGLRVTHNPNPVKAMRNGRSGSNYTWLYATSVEAIATELTVTEFGAFVEKNGHWTFSTYTGKPFTREDFADWHACPEALLQPGQPATDPSNWSGSNRLHPVKHLWCYIAVDRKGNQYYGEAIINGLAQLDEVSNH